MASWNRNSVERLPLAPDGYHPFAFDEEDMMELRSYESAFPRTFSLEAFPSPMDAPQPTHDSNALPVLLSGPPSWTSRVGLTTSFGHVSVVDEPTPPTFSYVPSPPPRPDPHRVRVRAVAPPPAPPRPLPHGAQPAPPPPPPPEWMDDMGDAEDMEQSSVDEEADDGAAARFEPAQDGLETPVVSWTNVVATVNMGCAINLKELITRTTGAEWRPQKFPAVCLRRTDPKATCLVFASGKCVVTGPQTVAQSQAACRRFVAVVAKAGYPATYADYQVVNLSAMFDCPFSIKLDSLAASLGARCKYNPDRYPGLTYKVTNASAKATLTVFATGKVVLVGCASPTAAINAAALAYPLLVPHNAPKGVAKPSKARRK